MPPLHTVFATREGLVGHRTSIGWEIDRDFPFVALPSVKALRRVLRVSNPLNGRSCYAVVMDVGPWNTHDDGYVFGLARPLAEQGIRQPGLGGPPLNKAGIDLGERVWSLLGMTDNANVVWEWF